MRKFLLPLLLTGCAPENKIPEASKPENVITQVVEDTDIEDQNSLSSAKVEAVMEKNSVREVARENFNKLANFIEKNGFKAGVGDTQYTLVDSLGNRHAFMAIRRDKNKAPSKKDPVTQISVWAYENEIKDQDHLFSYIISPDGVVESYPMDEKYKPMIERGYNELLAKSSED